MRSQMIKRCISNIKEKRIKRILVLGSNGQLGQSLKSRLDETYGMDNILYSDIQKNNKNGVQNYE